jgi:hypothetical protein
MELKPSSFVETGSCTGPRYIRNQPSRETAGVLLDSVTDKYVTEWTLPYTNMVAYTKELNNDWKKLDKTQKEVVANSLSLFLYQNPDAVITGIMSDKDKENALNALAQRTEKFGSDPLGDMYSFFDSNNGSISQLLTGIVKGKSTPKVKEELHTWIYNNSYYKIDNEHILGTVIMLVIFLLIGVGIGYNA